MYSCLCQSAVLSARVAFIGFPAEVLSCGANMLDIVDDLFLLCQLLWLA